MEKNKHEGHQLAREGCGLRLYNVDGIDNNGDPKVGGIRKGKMNGWQFVVIVHSF